MATFLVLSLDDVQEYSDRSRNILQVQNSATSLTLTSSLPHKDSTGPKHHGGDNKDKYERASDEQHPISIHGNLPQATQYMNLKEKILFHQVHPAKLATDILASIVSLYFFWQHDLVTALLTHSCRPRSPPFWSSVSQISSRTKIPASAHTSSAT